MVRAIFCVILKLVMIIYFKVKIINVERFETLKTGCVITPNHVSAWDTILVPAFTKRIMYMMAKEELFKGKIKNWFFRELKAFPVKRGKNDLSAVKNAIKLLKDGKSVCMFPEGTRNKDGKDMEFKTGAIMIAVTAKVPIIPVGIVSDFKFRSKVKVVYGEPIYFDEYYDHKMTKEELKEAAEKLKKGVNKAIKSVKNEK